MPSNPSAEERARALYKAITADKLIHGGWEDYDQLTPPILAKALRVAERAAAEAMRDQCAAKLRAEAEALRDRARMLLRNKETDNAANAWNRSCHHDAAAVVVDAAPLPGDEPEPESEA